jgi:hypothetical protein
MLINTVRLFSTTLSPTKRLTNMSAFREELEINEQAESIRDRIVQWEHQRAAKFDTASDDVGDLQTMLNEMHQLEEERRNSQHLGS